MAYSIDTGLLRDGTGLVAGVLVFALILAFRPRWQPARRQILWLGAGWLAVWSLEYWILGPASFVHYYDEGDSFIPVMLYRANHFIGGGFAHAIAGGSDATSMMATGGQLVSLEYGLFSALPLWLALLVHKLMVGGVALAGGYLLCRRICRCDRLAALALAAFYSLSHAYLTISTTHHGIGYASIPLAMVLIAGRTGRAGYFLPVILYSAVVATSIVPTHSLLALLTGIVCGALLFKPLQADFDWRRYLAGGAILTLAILLNWGSMLYALAEYAPYSARANATGAFAPLLIDVPGNALGFALSKLPAFVVSGPLLLFALVVLWRRKDALARGAAGATAVALFAGALMMAVPWRELGLGPLAAMRLVVAVFALPAVTIAVLARSFACLPGLGNHSPLVVSLGLAVAAALAVGSLGWYKTFNLVNFLGDGGQRTLAAIPNLAAPDWRDHGGTTRVVTVPYKLPPMALLGYGFSTFDSYTNIVPRERAVFWWRALRRTPSPLQAVTAASLVGGELIVMPRDADFRGKTRLPLADAVNLDFLRLGNVGHVISYLPLTDSRLIRVSGPKEARTARRGRSYAAKLREDFAHVLNPQPVHVYAVPDPLPVAFFAVGIETLPGPVDSPSFYGIVAARALRRIAVARKDAAPSAAQRLVQAGGAHVTVLAAVKDGWDISVTAPGGGILVVNTPFLPFWKAGVDAEPLAVFPVNGIHLAITVPPGAKRIALRYDPPRLGKRLAGFLAL